MEVALSDTLRKKLPSKFLLNQTRYISQKQVEKVKTFQGVIEKLLIFITLASTATQSQLAFAKPVFLYFPPSFSVNSVHDQIKGAPSKWQRLQQHVTNIVIPQNADTLENFCF